MNVTKGPEVTDALSPRLSEMVLEEESLLEALRSSVEGVLRPKGRLPDMRAPCFAHLRVRSRGRMRDLLLGWETFLTSSAAKVSILDWQTSPMASVFFAYRQGDAYEEELDDGRLLTGEIIARRLLGFDEGDLVAIDAPEGWLRRDRTGSWRLARPEEAPRLGTAGGAAPDDLPSPLGFTEAMLDATQREAVARQQARTMLVLGEAGCGKTLVALFRLARWARSHPEADREREMAAVVPEAGLSQMIQRILSRLGLGAVPVHTFDDWVVERARREIPGLPRRLCANTPPAVERFKRHPALREILPAFVEDQGRRLAEGIDRALGTRGAIPQIFEATEGANLRIRLDQTEAEVRQLARLLPQEISRTFSKAKRQLRDVRWALEELLADRRWHDEVLDRALGELSADDSQQVLAHLRRQMNLTTEERFADVVDQSRLTTLDGQAIDWGTPDEATGTLDVADHALLLELRRHLGGDEDVQPSGLHPLRYLVVDEAQDLAPIELALLGRAVAPDGWLTVAGDRGQQIDPAARFTTWEATLGELGTREADTVLLTTTYRCPRPVAEFGRAVLGELAPDYSLEAAREGAAQSVCELGFRTAGHQAVFLIEAITDLMRREPGASVALITRRESTAAQLYRALSMGLTLRLVRSGNFSFGPGVEVTDASQVKGLELDYVILPDASALNYSETPLDRRTLHVAVTRARRQLWLSWVGNPSPLLPQRWKATQSPEPDRSKRRS
jgi:DNA helicase-2/ATP-dependent DNA helicase PcrA